MELGYSIGAVERETGLSKDTLRVWERRYGFPAPSRDESGDRVYPVSQVARLRLIKRLLDQGHRPGKVVLLEPQDAERLLTPCEAADTPVPREDGAEEVRDDLVGYIALCKAYRFDEMRRQLSQVLLRIGLRRFVVDVIAPLNMMVGARWAEGSFAVYEEHLYTESVKIVMRGAISSIPLARPDSLSRPRVLMTTFPEEKHALGLLMAEALFALEGARCISLGVETPIGAIGMAARSQRADVVALSFSGAMGSNQLVAGLTDLRTTLPKHIEIWVGGGAPALRRPLPVPVRVLGLNDVGLAVDQWRQRHADAGLTCSG